MTYVKPTRLPEPTTDVEQIKEDISSCGFAIVKDILTPAEVREARERLVEQARLEGEKGIALLSEGNTDTQYIGSPKVADGMPWQLVRMLLNKGAIFRDIIRKPIILQMMQHIFGTDDFYFSSSAGFIIRKGAMQQTLHSDQLYVPHHTPVPYVANCMVMLSDFSFENGGTRVVPGTHAYEPPQYELRETAGGGKKIEIANWLPEMEEGAAEGTAGSGVLFDGRLWHGGGPSTSDNTRYSITTYFARSFMRQQDNIPAGLHKSVYDEMDDDFRALVGFKMQNNIGRIDPTEPNGRTNTNVQWPFVSELHDD